MIPPHWKALARAIKAIEAIGLVMGLLGVGLSAQPARADGLYAWGGNAYGQIGDGTTTERHSPVAVTGMSSGVSSIAAGDIHSLALKNGVLYAWGSNDDGEFGDGGAEDYSTTPVAISGFGSGVTAIAGGAFHSLAVHNGALYASGYNGSGQLGDGTTDESFAPVAVSGMGCGVTTVKGGEFKSLAIKNGALYAWGWNTNGQLGDGTTTERDTPTAVSGLGSGVTAVAAGDYHTMAVQNGALYAWGRNDLGQLGDGTTTDRYTPVAVGGIGSSVTSIAIGPYNSLAVRNGEVYAWGDNFSGELGNGTVDDNVHSTPALVSGLSGITAVATEDTSNYALDTNGLLWAWGFNDRGQLGLGDTTDRLIPTEVFAPAGYKFTSIDVGASGFVLATVVAVPEPGSFVLAALGIVGLAAWLGRRRGGWGDPVPQAELQHCRTELVAHEGNSIRV
jgi:alpha-tubulin suppressor-like RCC1 family protein